MRILWLSQHHPVHRQIAALRRRFGDVEICQDVNPFENAKEIKSLYDMGGYDDHG